MQSSSLGMNVERPKVLMYLVPGRLSRVPRVRTRLITGVSSSGGTGVCADLVPDHDGDKSTNIKAEVSQQGAQQIFAGQASHIGLWNTSRQVSPRS